MEMETYAPTTASNSVDEGDTRTTSNQSISSNGVTGLQFNSNQLFPTVDNQSIQNFSFLTPNFNGSNDDFTAVLALFAHQQQQYNALAAATTVSNDIYQQPNKNSKNSVDLLKSLANIVANKNSDVIANTQSINLN